MASVPPKRLCVCCDGTWDDSSDADTPPTNVTKIARSIKVDGKKGDQPIQQIAYYQAGIGTQGGKIANLLDGATGRGISENIREAYGFICNNYNDGDEIFLIGFSRGAFTARAISSLISDVGLLTKGGLGYFYDIFDQWEKQNQKAKKDDADSTSVTSPEFQQKLKGITRPNIPIKCCAVWDTVGALGIPVEGYDNSYSFVNTKVSPNIEYAFQALAIDEHRKPFSPTVWEKPQGQQNPRILRQCWFTGYHSIIGGGNSDNNELPNIALAWMITQLKDLLDFDVSVVKARPDIRQLAAQSKLKSEPDPNKTTIQDSYKGLYLLTGSQTRTPGQYHFLNPMTGSPTSRLLRNTNETIHASVRQRFIDTKSHVLSSTTPYYPSALKDWEFQDGETPQWVFKGKSWEGEKIGPITEWVVGDYEAGILKSWASSGDSLANFDLQDATF